MRVVMETDSLELVFVNGPLGIDLSDAAYTGPEALLLTGPGSTPFVVC